MDLITEAQDRHCSEYLKVMRCKYRVISAERITAYILPGGRGLSYDTMSYIQGTELHVTLMQTDDLLLYDHVITPHTKVVCIERALDSLKGQLQKEQK